MTSLAERRVAGLLLVLVPLAFAICFTLLQQLFEYPDILRQPTADVLAKFRAGGAPLVAVWYALTATALLFSRLPPPAFCSSRCPCWCTASWPRARRRPCSGSRRPAGSCPGWSRRSGSCAG